MKYILHFIRNFKKYKLYYSIGIITLVLGFTTFIVSTTLLIHENEYDNFILDKENVYRVVSERKKNNILIENDSRSPTALRLFLKNEIGQVEYATRAYFEKCLIYNDRSKLLDEDVLWVDDDFIKVFPSKYFEGIKSESFKNPNNLFLSKSLANKYFGKSDPIGQILMVNEGMPMKVSGVFDDLPETSHLKVKVLFSLKTYESYGWLRKNGSWDGYNMHTYVKLKDNSDPVLAENIINKGVDKNLKGLKNRNESVHFSLQPLEKIHFDVKNVGSFHVATNKKNIQMLFFGGCAILLLALINYGNMYVFICTNQLKQFGIRKIIGASKRKVFFTAISDSIIISIISVSATLLLLLALELFLYEKIEIKVYSNIYILYLVFFLIVMTLFFSIYPAFIASSLKLITIIRGKSNSIFSNRKNFNSFLLVFQMFVAIFFIISTLLVFKQVKFMVNHDTRMGLGNTIVIPGPRSFNASFNEKEKIGLKNRRFNSFKVKLKDKLNIKDVSASKHIPGDAVKSTTTNVYQIGKRSEESSDYNYKIFAIDHEYFSTFNITIIEGENFKSALNTYGIDEKNVIINEKAVKALGFENSRAAINATIKVNKGNRKIVGVIGNVLQRGMKEKVYPTIYTNIHPNEFGFYSININNNDIYGTIQNIRNIWESVYSIDPFAYTFVDNSFSKLYEKDYTFLRIFFYLSIISIFISCIGLFAISNLDMKNRKREIAIRKVLGIESFNLLFLLSKRFLIIFLVSMVISIVGSIIFERQWLLNYEYKVDRSFLDYVLPLFFAFIINLVIILINVIKNTKLKLDL